MSEMKILLTIDDSKASGAAVRAVADQFCASKAEIQVLHVVETLLLPGPPQFSARAISEVNEIDAERMKEARKLVDEAAAQLQKAGFKASGMVAEGDIRQRIIDIAADWQADLIVMGSRGRHGFDRLLLGSVSEAVTRHALCSVEVVRTPKSK